MKLMVCLINANRYLYFEIKVMYYEKMTCLVNQKMSIQKNKNLEETGSKVKVFIFY